MTTQPDTQFTANPGALDATVVAVQNAPRSAVLRAYTDPDLFVQWWGPRELTSKVEEFDPTPGGRWRISHTDPDGNAFAFRGVYHTVDEDRIIQTFEFEMLPGHVCLQTTTFEEVEGGTRITAQAVFQSVEDRDGMKESGMEDFAPVGMRQLAEVLAAL